MNGLWLTVRDNLMTDNHIPRTEVLATPLPNSNMKSDYFSLSWTRTGNWTHCSSTFVVVLLAFSVYFQFLVTCCELHRQ